MTFEDKLKAEAKKAADVHDLGVMKESAGHDLFMRMEELFGGANLAMDWYYSENPAFERKTPYQVCLAGEGDRIKRAVYHMASGMPC